MSAHHNPHPVRLNDHGRVHQLRQREGRPVQQRGANLSKEEDIILTKGEGTKEGRRREGG